MPHTVRKEGGGVIRIFTGLVSGADYLAEVERLQGMADFDDVRFVVEDFSNAELGSEWFEELDFVAAITKAASLSNKACRLAYVLQDANLRDVCSEKYKSFGHSDEGFSVFVNMETAVAWAKRRRLYL